MQGNSFAQSISQGFGQNSNLMAGVAKNLIFNKASSFLPQMPTGYQGMIFNQQIKSYFDVDTQTVKNKILKLLLPFKTFQFDDQIKKLELYLPIVSFMTLIMFSTLLEGIQSKQFTPKIGNRTFWILIFTLIEVSLAKFTQNAISNLNLGTIQLISLVSYRFVSLSLVAIVLVLSNNLLGFLRYIGIIYVLIVDTYYCVFMSVQQKLQLSNCSRQRFKQEGLGNKIAVGVHVLTTIVIMWYSSIL